MYKKMLGNVCAAIAVVLLSAVPAAAVPIVHLDANPLVAISIEDLDIGGTLYDVRFERTLSAVFDGDSAAAAAAINAALNSTLTAGFVSVPGVGSINNYNVFSTSGDWVFSSSFSNPTAWAVLGTGSLPNQPFNPSIRAVITAAVPVPGVMFLFGIGFLGLLAARGKSGI